jgi:hypothetical protein
MSSEPWSPSAACRGNGKPFIPAGRAADFIVPATLAEHELVEYLADLFHEDATPKWNEVVRIA